MFSVKTLDPPVRCSTKRIKKNSNKMFKILAKTHAIIYCRKDAEMIFSNIENSPVKNE
jgi:hypothetical protein